MVNKKKLKKQFKRKFEFGREVFGKHAYPKAIKLHDDIKDLIQNNYIGQEFNYNWDIKSQLIDNVQKLSLIHI